MTDCGRKSTNW